MTSVNWYTSPKCYSYLLYLYFSSSNARTMEFHFIIETSEQSKMATFEKTLLSRGLVGDIPFYNTSLSVKSIPGEQLTCISFHLLIWFCCNCFIAFVNL